MSNGGVAFMLGFFLVCWGLVAAHQLGWYGPDPFQRTMLRGALIIGYVGAGMSVAVLAVAVAAALKERQRA